MDYKEQFLAHCQSRGYSDNTIINYRIDLRDFTPSGYTREEIQSCVSALDRYKPSTRARKVSSIKSYLKWMHFSGIIDEPADRFLITPKKPRTLPRVITRHNVRAYLNILERKRENRPVYLRDRLMVMILMSTGIRKSEMLSLKWADVSKLNVMVEKGKGGKDRMVYMSQWTRKWMDKWKNNCLERWEDLPEYIFVGSHNRKPLSPSYVQKLFKWISSYSQTPVTPHDLRHYYATTLVEAGVDLPTIQELMGHDSIQSTMIYANVSDIHKKTEYLRAYSRGY